MVKKKDDPSGIDWSREEKILSEQNNPTSVKKESFFSTIPPKTILISIGVLALIVLVVFGLKSLSGVINATGEVVAETSIADELKETDYICPDGTLAASKDDCGKVETSDNTDNTESDDSSATDTETVIEVEEKEEPVVTTYENSQLVLMNIQCEWKETYGKVKAVEYTLTNGENGRIQPAKAFIFNEDRVRFPKEYALSGEFSDLKSGATKPFTLEIPLEGSITAPADISKQFGLYLVDSNDKRIGDTAYYDFTMSETTCTG